MTEDIFEPECPVVSFCGSGIYTIDALCQLRDQFLSNGYQCACLCDYPFSYLYGLDYLPEIPNRTAAIQYIYKLYSPDIILVCIDRNRENGVYYPDEYLVMVGDEATEYTVRKGTPMTGSARINSDFRTEDVSTLYEKITGAYI